jgi:hydrogenase maturation protein HypF
MTAARSIRVRGVVQGVGFRPFVFRLARENRLAGWVLNEQDGVDIHLEGDEGCLASFLSALQYQAPPAASITAVDVQPAEEAALGSCSIPRTRAITIRTSTAPIVGRALR